MEGFEYKSRNFAGNRPAHRVRDDLHRRLRVVRDGDDKISYLNRAEYGTSSDTILLLAGMKTIDGEHETRHSDQPHFGHKK